MIKRWDIGVKASEAVHRMLYPITSTNEMMKLLESGADLEEDGTAKAE